MNASEHHSAALKQLRALRTPLRAFEHLRTYSTVDNSILRLFGRPFRTTRAPPYLDGHVPRIRVQGYQRLVMR